MRIKRTSFLISMVAILLALLVWIVPNSETAHAADTTGVVPQSSISVSGLESSDAIITDPNGNPVMANDPFYNWTEYNLTYNWSIADNEPIKNGDTATFELPSSVKLTANLTNIPIYNENNVQIGTFTIKAGETTGTITFNDVLSSTNIDRKGSITFHVRGTNTNTENPGQFEWNINKVGWLSDYDENGLPKYVVWNIAFNPRGENLTNVVVTDKLSPGQTYVDGSVYAPTGYYNENGNFIPDGKTLSPQVVQNGDEVKFYFGNVSSAVDMTFKVLIKVDPEQDNVYNDNATLTSDQITGDVSSNVQYGGSGNGTGSAVLGNLVLQKTDESGKPLAGAIYELKDSTGKVLMSEVAAGDNGQLKIYDLPVGTYTLTEVRAPEGYELNSNPMTFTVQPNEKNQVINLTQEDYPETTPPTVEPDTGNVIFDKVSVTTGDLLPGAEYDLLDADGNVIQSGLVTDSEGRISVSGLKTGNYAFKETKAPDGYESSTDLIPFTITKDQTFAVTASDNLTGNESNNNGGAVLTKTDVNGKPLANAVYELKDPNGEVIDQYATDKDGKLIFGFLADGDYTLTEVKAPDGYEINKTPIKFTVVSGKITELSATDEKSPTEPETPTVPGEPQEPEVPSVPGEPQEPEVPSVPGEPQEPEVPSVPGEPQEPEVPSVPGEPQEPEMPVLPETPNHNNDEEYSGGEYNGEESNNGSTVTKPELSESPSYSTTTEKPSVTSPESITPEQAANPGSYGTYMSKGSTRFPQTGDKENALITIVGFMILIGLAGFEINHKHI